MRELDSTRAIFGLRPLWDVLDGALDRPRFAQPLGIDAAGAAVPSVHAPFAITKLAPEGTERHLC